MLPASSPTLVRWLALLGFLLGTGGVGALRGAPPQSIEISPRRLAINGAVVATAPAPVRRPPNQVTGRLGLDLSRDRVGSFNLDLGRIEQVLGKPNRIEPTPLGFSYLWDEFGVRVPVVRKRRRPYGFYVLVSLARGPNDPRRPFGGQLVVDGALITANTSSAALVKLGFTASPYLLLKPVNRASIHISLTTELADDPAVKVHEAGIEQQ